MVRFEIRDADILHNIEIIKKRAGAAVWGVIKYDGYGIGLLHMAGLLRGCGITHFAVSRADDVHALRGAGYMHESILLLQPETDDSRLRMLLRDGAVLSVGSLSYLGRIKAAAAGTGCIPHVHVAVDTGLGRFGFLPQEYESITAVYRTAGISVDGIYTHFAAACTDGKKTKKQFAAFLSLLGCLESDGIPRGMAHAANSGGLFCHDGMQLDAVRTGSALVGRVGGACPEKTGLVHAGRVSAEVCEVRNLPAGSRIGYCGEAKLRRDSAVAVIALGRQAGIDPPSLRMKLLGRRMHVCINGGAFPVISSNSAGYTYADVTGADVRPGDIAYADVNPLHVDGRIEKVYL